jgi:hypothetical protein
MLERREAFLQCGESKGGYGLLAAYCTTTPARQEDGGEDEGL